MIQYLVRLEILRPYGMMGYFLWQLPGTRRTGHRNNRYVPLDCPACEQGHKRKDYTRGKAAGISDILGVANRFPVEL